MFNWKEEYNTGIKNIDEQHQKLFEIANHVYDLLKNEFCVDKYDKIVEVIEELKEYTVYHFKFEEEYMMSIGYKKLLSHKVQHTDFIEKINGIDLSKMDEHQEKYIMELLDFVVNWITGHILGSDKLYAQ